MNIQLPFIVASNWQCPHCQVWSSLDGDQYKTTIVNLGENADRLSSLKIHVVVCKNGSCRKVTILADLNGLSPVATNATTGSTARKAGIIRSYKLVPDLKAKPQPSYIPLQIVADYREAYLIASLSPKASATLSRRCLQGMIRDFHGVSGKKPFFRKSMRYKHAYRLMYGRPLMPSEKSGISGRTWRMISTL